MNDARVCVCVCWRKLFRLNDNKIESKSLCAQNELMLLETQDERKWGEQRLSGTCQQRRVETHSIYIVHDVVASIWTRNITTTTRMETHIPSRADEREWNIKTMQNQNQANVIIYGWLFFRSGCVR